MGLTTLGLMLGYGCNARCRTCLWGEQIHQPARMSIEEGCSWVDQAYALGDLLLVGFSGGEPFLYAKEMQAIIRYANNTYGLPSVASTNAFWAVTAERAQTILGDLYDLGLRELLISVDDFHQEWVPLERVRYCLRAAQALEIACTLQCLVTASSNKLEHYMRELDIPEGAKVMASEIPCTPVGFAAETLPASEFTLHPGVPSDYCTMLQTVIVPPKRERCTFAVGPHSP